MLRKIDRTALVYNFNKAFSNQANADLEAKLNSMTQNIKQLENGHIYSNKHLYLKGSLFSQKQSTLRNDRLFTPNESKLLNRDELFKRTDFQISKASLENAKKFEESNNPRSEILKTTEENFTKEDQEEFDENAIYHVIGELYEKLNTKVLSIE